MDDIRPDDVPDTDAWREAQADLAWEYYLDAQGYADQAWDDHLKALADADGAVPNA